MKPQNLHITGNFCKPISLVAVSFLLFILSSNLSCNQGNSANGGKSATVNDRGQLIGQLVEKGDQSVSKDRDIAYSAYRFAAFYAPKDEAITAKLKPKEKWLVGMAPITDSLTSRVSAFVYPNYRDPAASTPEMDIVNLRMLLDERLVGKMYYVVFSFQGGRLGATFPPNDTASPGIREVCVFTSEPQLSLSQIKEIYGKPSEDLGRILIYGRFTLVGDETNQLRLVLFPLFRE